MYLHVENWAGLFAYPVDVLSKGAKFATVRLRHETRIGRTSFPSGTVKRRVPLWSLSANPRASANVSTGGGRFVPQ